MKDKRGFAGRRLGTLALLLVFMLLLGLTALAAGTEYSDLQGVTWAYEEGDGLRLTMIQDGGQAIENAAALLISAELRGEPVRAVQSNGFDNVVVGHKANEYILIAEGVEDIGAMTFYDFNFAKSVSFPASMESIDFNAFDVLGREINNATVIYGAAGSEAEPSGESGGEVSGEMGGEASGEAGGSGEMGGPQFSTGASNCAHGEPLVITDWTASFDRDGIAELSWTAEGFALRALQPGEAELRLRCTLADGTQRTLQSHVSVA